jgi:hypothetical protein
MNLVCKISCAGAAVMLIAGDAVAAADSKKEARVTQIIREVKLLPSEAEARLAVVNERVSENTAVRTGDASRSELTFADLTLTRLGENTIFSFARAGHNARLDSGSILLRVPKNSGGGSIRTRAVTVGITGTTVIFESTRAGRSKLIALEGGARMALVNYPRQSAYVRAGQMLDVPAGATTMPEPVNIDLDRVMKTSPLIKDFPPLPSEGLIMAVIREQQNAEPVFQGVAVSDPIRGYPVTPPFYPGGPGSGGPGRHPGGGGGKPPPSGGGGPSATGGQPDGPSDDTGGGTRPPGGTKPPPGGVKPPRGAGTPAIGRVAQPRGAGALTGTSATARKLNVFRAQPKKTVPRKDEPRIR